MNLYGYYNGQMCAEILLWAWLHFMLFLDFHPQRGFVSGYFCFLCPVVPATSIPKVCAVYDGMNKTLQFIESTWNELVC